MVACESLVSLLRLASGSQPRPAPTEDEDIQEVVPISPLVKAEPQPYQERQDTSHALAAQEDEQVYEEGYEDYGQYEEGGYEGGLLEVEGNKGRLYSLPVEELLVKYD